jgi:twitching motility protein PilT
MLTGSKDGMSTLEQSLNTLVRAGVVSYDEAVVRTLYPKEIEVAERA